MKKQILAAAVIATVGLGSTTAFARPHHAEFAPVVASIPVYETIQVPRQECWTQPVTTYESRHVGAYPTNPNPAIGAGTVIGAVVGGVIGHQFGHSSGSRDRATAAGAIVGGLAGYAADRGYVQAVETVPVTRPVSQCRTVMDVQQRLVGYDVRYLYHGREYLTRVPQAPGRTIPVNVNVVPGGPVPVRGYGPMTPVYVR